MTAVPGGQFVAEYQARLATQLRDVRDHR
jgi:hypothetical protein